MTRTFCDDGEALQAAVTIVIKVVAALGLLKSFHALVQRVQLCDNARWKYIE